MHLDLFDYHLPNHLIARQPCEQRDQSRLMVLRREKGQPGSNATVEHHPFWELPALLDPGDLLVLNDTRVVPARLVGHRQVGHNVSTSWRESVEEPTPTSGLPKTKDRLFPSRHHDGSTRSGQATGGKWEGLFVRVHPDGLWELLCQTRGRLAPGDILHAEAPESQEATGTSLPLLLESSLPGGRWLVRPLVRPPLGDSMPWDQLLYHFGHIPLPPYIRKGRGGEEETTIQEQQDRDRYQTIYAREPGAVAAPTAGLHFTPELFEALRQHGVESAFVTLHVGPGTFRPVEVENIAKHHMEAEWGELPAHTAQRIAHCKEQGGRVIAVGTTTVRVLETAAQANEGSLQAWKGQTDLTIRPPYTFRAIDALITNFHLPRSSLLLLVSAFAGLETIQRAYQIAVEQQYRFYSYGDAMLIV